MRIARLRPARGPRSLLLIALGAALACVAPAAAGEAPAQSARAQLALAEDAARAWASDARLVYLENDAAPDAQGAAPRWGYLFHSEARGASRVYSLAGGRIEEARDLAFAFAAPPLAPDWLDSDAARAAAEAAGGREFCLKESGRLASLVLLRGALFPERPDLGTWALIYSAPQAPSLTILIDAASGKRVRTWRG